MKIRLVRNAVSGDVRVPMGDYNVTLLPETFQMNLIGGGKDYRIPAKKRRQKGRVKITTVSFYCGGGLQWSLVVNTPKHGEWLAIVEYVKTEP